MRKVKPLGFLLNGSVFIFNIFFLILHFLKKTTFYLLYNLVENVQQQYQGDPETNTTDVLHAIILPSHYIYLLTP
jgi:hypothetical protein